MVALKTERRVYMWHVTPVAIPKNAPVSVSLSEVIDILKAAYSAGNAEMFLSDTNRVLPVDSPSGTLDPKNRVYVSDIVEDAHTLTFLINRGDPNVTDPAFINVKSDTVKTISPGVDETQGWSAHLVINKAKKKPSDVSYRACYERVPHANSWSAETLIRTILDRHAEANPKYTYQKTVKPKGKRKGSTETQTYRPALSVRKVPSDQLKEDIKEGVISSITLINSKATFSGIDAPDIVQSVKSKLVIRPKKVDQPTVLKYIDKLAPWAKGQGFTEIQIKIEDLPGNASASPTFLLEQGDAMETLYSRSQRLDGFSVLLETCYAKVCPPIRTKIIGLINSSDKW